MTFPHLSDQLRDMEHKLRLDEAERAARRWRHAAIFWSIVAIAFLAVAIEGFGG